MSMITEDYCSYEVLELLKQKACDEIMFSSYQPKNNKDGTSIIYSTCSHQVAMAFLRKKGIYICPKHCCFCGSKPKDVQYFLWEPRIIRLPGNNIIYPQPLDMCKHYEKFEEAVDAALKYSLENLI